MLCFFHFFWTVHQSYGFLFKKCKANNYCTIRFNLEQRDICMYRLKLLQYLDRLSTYEVILGGVHVAHVEYSGTFFEQFREINIVQAAVDYARVSLTCGSLQSWVYCTLYLFCGC